MSSDKCVVEGCDLEYDVVCSFSFYNVNTLSDNVQSRQEWIEGAMHQESECLWRRVRLQLCGYHFEMDAQGLWIDTPVLPEVLTRREQVALPATQLQKIKGAAKALEVNDPQKDSYQGLFEQFIAEKPKVVDLIRLEHNYCATPVMVEEPGASRLNVRHLVDALGYLSLKNLQRKQLWVVKVDTGKSEATISQTEQVITKMTNPMQLIEIIPPQATTSSSVEAFPVAEDSTIPDNFIYEIAEEQEIAMDEVKTLPQTRPQEWSVNIVPEEPKSKYSYIKHCTSGKKRRHFTADINEVALHGDFENYYILPDADPSVGVEVTTSYEPENYIVEDYKHLILQDRQKKRPKESKDDKRRKKRPSVREQVKQIKTEIGDDWVIENDVPYEDDDDDDDEAKKGNSRVRRKNRRYCDFVT